MKGRPQGYARKCRGRGEGADRGPCPGAAGVPLVYARGRARRPAAAKAKAPTSATTTLRHEATATSGEGEKRSWGQTTAGSVSVDGVARKRVSSDSFRDTAKAAAA